jgi:glycosyltransferase involved in cell wall biosynthesis
MDDAVADGIRQDTSYRYVRKHRGLMGLVKAVFQFKKELKRQIKECDVVIVYDLVYAWLSLPKIARKHQKKTILVLADYSGEESFHSIGRKTYARLQKRSMRRYDVVVGLSEGLKSFLHPRQRFMLMEGGLKRELFDSLAHEPKMNQKEITLVYSGLLNEVTGVMEFLKAMEQVMKSKELDDSRGEYATSKVRCIITGKGDMDADIAKMAEKYAWLDFEGHLSYDQYIEVIKHADVLVNPRDMRLPENHNNFPSKIIDYLTTGNMILSTRFAGYERFKDEIRFTDIESLECALEDNIMQAMQMTAEEKKKLYEHNREFVKQFLWENQLQRILQLV